MDCLSPDQLVAYVRGGGADPRGIEAHVRDCPACAMELLLVRETLGEPRARAARPATDRFRNVPRQRPVVWIPWVAAAAVLVAAVLFAVMSQKPPAPLPVARPPEPKPPKVVVPPTPKPEPEPEPRTPAPPPPVPQAPEPQPEPKPAPKPEPVKPPEPVRPPPPSPTPKPEPEPRKPAPTLVEKAVVARVLHSVGGPATSVGRVIRAGEAVVTARQEFLDVAVEGYGRVYLRENSQAEIGLSGDIVLHDGEMLARLDPGKKPGSIRTPVAAVEPQATLFNVAANKTFAEVSILGGRVMVASTPATGPATVLVKAGKAPEIRPLEAGFASWLPDKLASRKFTGWFEAEEFPTLQGFKVMPSDAASGGKSAVQVADAGGIAIKGGLPFKGRHVVWLRVRQYEAKPVLIGIHLGGQPAGEVKLEGAEGKPWRWVGPLAVNSDKLDLAVTALSRFPFRENDERRSFPVVVDAALVTTDVKFVPAERIPEEGRHLDLVLDEPTR